MSRLVIPLVVLLFTASPLFAQDPVKVDPAHHEVEMENDQVRVLRITFGPGEKAPLHDHPAAVAVFLTDNRLEVVPQGGKADPTQRKRGEAIFAPATKHTVNNPGTDRAEVILVELKAPAAPGAIADDAVKTDPKHYTVELENERVRIVRIRYGPGEKSMMHGHRAGPAVMLTDGSVRFTDVSGKSETQTFSAGGVNWDPGSKHLPENVGGKPFEAVLVEIKPRE